MSNIDTRVLSPLNHFASSGWAASEVTRLLATYPIFILISILAVAALLPASVPARRAALSAVCAGGLGLLFGQVMAHFWDRPRPFAGSSGAIALIQHSADSSFPSDHAIVAFAIATSLLFWNRRAGICGLVLAAIICLARVSAGVHFPSDVAAGAIVGAGTALLMQIPSVQRLISIVADHVGATYDSFLGHLGLSS